MSTRIAAIYARISTQEQREATVPSTGIQVQQCREKAATLNIPVSTNRNLIVEEQHSGDDLRWAGTQFMDLVRRAQRHEFTDLICLDMDRFCRGGTGAYFEQEGYFTDARVTLHWVNFDVPPDMPFRGVILAARADAAQFWKDRIKQSSKDAREGYAKQGNIIRGNTPPFGWEFVYDDHRVTKRNRQLVVGLKPHPVYSPILLHMYEHVVNGGTVGALGRWLESERIATPKGALVWHGATIRRILHNPTNWGERRSFTTVHAPHPEGVRRSANTKSKFVKQRVSIEDQYTVDPSVISPIPGLTRDLAMRALRQLEQNQEAHSTSVKAVDSEERAERGLLFGGMVRCGTCKKRGMRVKHNPYNWLYICYHRGTDYEGQPCVSMSTNKLDKAVWSVAVNAVKNPAFFDQVLDTTDRIAGPAARAQALQHQLEAAQKEHSNLRKHLARLDPDEPEDQELIASIEQDIREKASVVRELGASLASVQEEQRTEDARQATLQAFRSYADENRSRLDSMTPLEKHNLLRAMGVRVRLNGGEDSVDKVWIVFDLRGLPGAAEWMRDDLGEHPQNVIDLDAMEDGVHGLPWYTYQLIQTEQGRLFENVPSTYTPPTLEEAREHGFKTVEEYEQYIAARENGEGGILEAGNEPSGQATPGVPVARTRS